MDRVKPEVTLANVKDCFFFLRMTSWELANVGRQCRALIRTCASHSAFDAGKKLHAAVVTSGQLNQWRSFLRNSLLHMYAACGDAISARKLFDEIPLGFKDTIDWTTLMDCYCRIGLSLDALDLFVAMRREGVAVDEITMISLFTACAKVGNNAFGIQGHGCFIKMGFGLGAKAWNAAMDMYVKCGLIADAQKLFQEFEGRNIVSWTVLLWGVLRWEGLQKGRMVFDEMPERNLIAWSIIIAKYAENSFTREAFNLLKEMVFTHSLHLNVSSSCLILSACTQSGDFVMGKWVHSFALKFAIDSSADVRYKTALLDMYAKCGLIDNAIRVFETMPIRNVITWNAMLGGLAMHGKGAMVLKMFDRMVEEIEPNDVTFTALLSACSHSGLVDEGRKLFNTMQNVYRMSPSMENYASMVDLLGRAGLIEEAEAVIRKMEIKPNEVVLGSLIGACRVHKKHELVEPLVRDLVRMHPYNTDHHILLANMYASLGKLDKADSLCRDLKQRGIRKVPGTSTMYVHGEAHHFNAGDRSHPQIKAICLKLDEMIRKLKRAGYVPGGADGTIDEQEEKESTLLFHSEKLALCFGLISTKPGTPLYIFKNLRICEDCHSAMKVASTVYDREIIIRDRYRFHSFKQGCCSCSDYW